MKKILSAFLVSALLLGASVYSFNEKTVAYDEHLPWDSQRNIAYDEHLPLESQKNLAYDTNLPPLSSKVTV